MRKYRVVTENTKVSTVFRLSTRPLLTSIHKLGTWVPLDKGVALAKQHNIDHLMKPLIEFQPAATSPPLAPKHLSAPSRPKRGRDSTDGPGGSMALRSSKRGAETATESRSPTPLGSEDGSNTTSPATASATSRTPSPIRNTSNHAADLNQFVSPPHRTTRARTAANARYKPFLSRTRTRARTCTSHVGRRRRKQPNRLC